MRKYVFYIWIFCQLFILQAVSQDNTDSAIAHLEKKLETKQSLTNEIISLNDLATLYLPISPTQSLDYAKTALEKSKLAENPFWTSESYRNVGNAELALGHNSFAWTNYELAYENDRISDNMPSKIISLNSMGDFYVHLEKYDKAIGFYLDALKMYEKQGAYSKVNLQYIKLGVNFMKAGDSFKGLEYFMKSLSYYQEESDSLGIAQINNEIGKVYQHLDKPDKAIAYYTKALNIYRKLDRKELGFEPSINIGIIYLDEGKLDLARNTFTETFHFQKSLNKLDNISICYQKLATLEDKSGNTQLAINYLDSALQIEINSQENKNQCLILYALAELNVKLRQYPFAIEYLTKATDIAQSENYIECLAKSYMLKAKVYESIGNFEKALEFNKLSSAYNDSLAVIKKENNTLAMKTNLLVEEKQRENELLLIDNQVKTQKIKDNRYVVIYFILLIIIIVTLAIITFLFFQQKISNRIKWETHSKLYEEALKKYKVTETKYEAVVEQSYDIIYIQRGTKIVFANKKAILLSGYSEAELYDQEVSSFFHPDDVEIHHEQMRNPLKQGQTRSFTSRLVDKYGNVFTFEIISRRVVMNSEEVNIGVGRDLTERIEAEDALSKSNQRNKNLIQNSPSGILYINQNGDVVENNPSAAVILGLDEKKPEKLQKYYDLFPEKESKVTSHIKKCFENGKVITDDCRFMSLKNDLFFLQYSLAPIKNTDGSVNSVIMNFNDITEKKKIEQAIILLEERYKLAFEGTNLGLWDWDLVNDRMIFNDQFYNILGYKRGEIMENRSSLMNLIFPDDRDMVTEILNKHIDEESEAYISEFRVLTKDGYWKWVVDHGKVVLRNDNGYPLRMVGTVRDITVRKNAEENLFQSEKKYRSLIENMQDGVFIIIDKKLKFVNHALARISGYKMEELLGMEYTKILDTSNIDHIDKKYSQRLNGPSTPTSYETKLMHKDGETIAYVNISVGVIDYEGRKAIHGTLKDITEKKSSEKILLKSEQNLREANATKDKFFSIIAHDLKNPFNAIMGFAHLLHEEFEEFSDDDKKRFIKNIWEASENTYKLVENLLQWSRAQTGKIPFKPEKIDLSIIANENISVLKPSAESKNIRVFSEVKFNTNVYGDPNMLTTVVRNLLSNAVKFTNPGGRVLISCKIMKDVAEVCIEDNGIGISKENQKKIFQFGEQFKREGTANERGTGLGLILCKEFIDRHQGELRIESKPGKGSKFFFTVPVY
ncbi:MAG: PAS domain S-box protein [Bacteroidales bacterium]|nr:PAS domain S-box protein [Bacteroidales bacterium]MCF8457135.1 PAS domain S-box protein [Bacteroidales bacterium]